MGFHFWMLCIHPFLFRGFVLLECLGFRQNRFGAFSHLGMLIQQSYVRQSSLSRFWPVDMLFRKNTFLELLISFRTFSDLLNSKRMRNLTRSRVHQFSARNVSYGPIWWQKGILYQVPGIRYILELKCHAVIHSPPHRQAVRP